MAALARLFSGWRAVAQLGITLLALCYAATSGAADLPQYGGGKHLGVATCASGVCHGSIQPLHTTNVLQNEFVTWTREDRHAGAYKLLFNNQSRRIARNLGIGNAHEADICLDCHADNVKPEMRGEKFQFDDGIGCEACHGGAETWIDSHTADATHEENLAAGMFPTEDLAARAELCMSCHVGTGKKFATHRIMGAGHPRLAFELDTFGVLQPQHYRVDADYEARKGDFSSFRNWVQGLVATAKQTLNLIQSSRFDNNRVYPELALFDCHACHHPMDDQRWRSREVTRGLGPGELRLNDASLVMLAAVAEVLSPGAHQEMVRKLRTMHTSVRKTRRDVLAASRALEQTVDQLGDQFRSVEISNSNMQKILGKLFKEGARGQYQDYVAAEQTAMAVDLLIIAMGEQDKYTALIDRLYSSVQNEHRFNARNFQKNLAALQSRTGY